MDFDPPETVRPLLEQIERFVTDVVMPAEEDVLERGWIAAGPLLEELRGKVKQAGLWGPQIPKELGGLGLGLVEHGLVSERLGRSPLGHYVFGCQAPDAGNIGDPPPLRHPRAEGALARAARARRAPLLLLDDRAREPGLQPHAPVVPRRPRRRPLRDRRPQVVHRAAPTARRSRS